MVSCSDAWWESFLASLTPSVIWRAQCAALVAREAWQKNLHFVRKFVKTSKPLAISAATLCEKRCLLAAVTPVSSIVNPAQIVDCDVSISDSLPFSDNDLERVAWQQSSEVVETSPEPNLVQHLAQHWLGPDSIPQKRSSALRGCAVSYWIKICLRPFQVPYDWFRIGRPSRDVVPPHRRGTAISSAASPVSLMFAVRFSACGWRVATNSPWCWVRPAKTNPDQIHGLFRARLPGNTWFWGGCCVAFRELYLWEADGSTSYSSRQRSNEIWATAFIYDDEDKMWRKAGFVEMLVSPPKRDQNEMGGLQKRGRFKTF